MQNTSLYIHIPFCKKRCYYCDFFSTAGREGEISAYVDALCIEIEKLAVNCPEKFPVHTVYFGGGTPSLLPIFELEKIISVLGKYYKLLPGLEMTLEANPGTIFPDYLKGLFQLGINRLSLGMQSADPEMLKLLGRVHGSFDVIQAVKWARQAGFENLSLDLICGLPGQGHDSWKRSLEMAGGLNPEHLSLYALSIEPGTRMAGWASRGLINVPDDDAVADMLEYAMEHLDLIGYTQYEISNWERRQDCEGSFECMHNLQYWRNLPYIGFGAAAHGFISNQRLENVADLDTYIYRIRQSSQPGFPFSPATVGSQEISRIMEMEETMMVGLRLTQEGVSQRLFYERFGESLLSRFNKEVLHLIAAGLLEMCGVDDDRMRLTRRGRLLGNQVFMQFVGSGD